MGGVPVVITDKGVPVSIQGDIPASAIPFGSPGDPAGPLGPDGRLPSSQMAVDALEYKGAWNASTNTPTLINGTGTVGDTYACSVTGTQNLGGGSVEYLAGNFVIYNGTVWDQIGAGNSPVAANPSVTVGLTAKNGTAETYMRSDGAPALDQSIVPTWTGAHTFTQTLSVLPAAGNGLVTTGTNSSGVPSIAAVGAAADISIEIKPKGSAGITLGGPTTVSGALTVSSFSTSGTATIGLLTASGMATFNGGITVNETGSQQVRIVNNQQMSGAAAALVVEGNNNNGPGIGIGNTSQGTDGKWWDVIPVTNTLNFRINNDAGSSSASYLAVSRSGMTLTGIASNSGTGSWTHTGTHTVVQSSDVYKVWIAKNTTADSQTAPTAIGAASTYLQIGGREWKVNGFGGIGFGYVTGTNVNPPVWVGWEEKVTSSFTNGDFIIATRSTNTNVAPTERLRVTAAGDLQAWPGYVPATTTSLATMGDVAARVAADGKTAQAANINAPTLYAVPTSGLYRVSSYIVVTQAATTSSTMPSVSVSYTEATSGVAVQDLITTTANLNQVGAHSGGSAVISAQQGSNIGYTTGGYASSGATPMQYAVHMKVEFLG